MANLLSFWIDAAYQVIVPSKERLPDQYPGQQRVSHPIP